MKAKKMPKVVYVRWEEDPNSDDGGWWNSAVDARDLFELGETINAGCYILKDKIQIESKVVIKIK